MIFPWNKYPYTNVHELNLTWVLEQINKLSEDMRNFIKFNTIKYADPLAWNITTQYQSNTIVMDNINHIAYLSTQPVPAGVLLTDTDYWTPILDLRGFYDAVGDLDQLQTIDRDDLVHAINEVLNYAKDGIDPENGLNIVKSINVDNGKFIFGNFSANIYANEVCTDGTYFYQVQSEYTGTETAYVVKLDKGGNVIDTYTFGDTAHYNVITYSKETNKLYILTSTQYSTALKLEPDFSAAEVISLNGSNIIDLDCSNGKFYAVTSDTVYEYPDEFVTIENTYSYVLPANITAGLQGFKVYKNILFIASNNPNQIVCIDLTANKIIKYIAADLIDGVLMGELQGIDIYDDGTYINIYTYGTKTVYSGYYYNKVCILAGNFSKYEIKPFSGNRNYVADYIVDGSSTSDHSLGTLDNPFKSLMECLEHCHYTENGQYKITVLDANNTIDFPSVDYFSEPLNLVIVFENIIPGNRFKWLDSILNITYKRIAATVDDIALYGCTAFISTTDSTSAGQYLSITNHWSNVIVDGNLANAYNDRGSFNINGKIGSAGSSTGINFIKQISKYPASDAPMMFVGDGLFYQKTMVISGNGTFKIQGEYTLHGILSFTSADGALFNRAYAIRGYGLGGSARTAVALMPPEVDEGNFSASVDPDSNSILVTVTGNPSAVRVNYLQYGYTPTEGTDTIGVIMSYT